MNIKPSLQKFQALLVILIKAISKVINSRIGPDLISEFQIIHILSLNLRATLYPETETYLISNIKFQISNFLWSGRFSNQNTYLKTFGLQYEMIPVRSRMERSFPRIMY